MNLELVKKALAEQIQAAQQGVPVGGEGEATVLDTLEQLSQVLEGVAQGVSSAQGMLDSLLGNDEEGAAGQLPGEAGDAQDAPVVSPEVQQALAAKLSQG